MQPMVTDATRRNLLKAALFGGCTPWLVNACSSTPSSACALIGCAIEGRERFSVVMADSAGQKIGQLPLPARGHGIAIHPHLPQAVAFARRPGQFMSVFDYQTAQQIVLRPADAPRYYYGHGVFSADGRFLYATEGEQKTSRGVIGVYEVAERYQKVAEFSGFGVGPHEVILMADGRLVVGVGGVHTFGREPLNLDTMQPSLTYLSAQGELLDQITLADRHLSIRHLAHDGAQTVLCGQQYRGQPDDYPPLVAMHKGSGPLIPLQAEPEQWARFNHYIASIAATGEWILATSPPGNCYGIWSKATGELVELAALSDASGVVVRHGAFQVSSGSGKIILQSAPEHAQTRMSNVMWDNHWSAIG
ncbi:DUF1513 domain-containing protein [Vibrio mimicus]|nr:DUF1513 domain-containing protein [Vibrio mimicus]